MTLDLDDLLHDTFHREADALADDPRTEAAWARLEAAARTATRSGPRPRLLVAAGAAAAVAAIAFVAQQDDSRTKVTSPLDDGPAVSTPATDEPTTSTTRTPVMSLPGVFPGTDFVAVRDDGILVRVTVATGVERELAAFGDPSSTSELAIQNVSLDPEGLTAYFEVSANSGGVSQIYSVPTEGSSDPVLVTDGRQPVVDPSGQRLAFIDRDLNLSVLLLGTDTVLQAPGAWGYDITWLMDGRLATTPLTETEFSPTAIATFTVTDTGIEPNEVFTPGEGESYRFPQASGIGSLYAVNACCGDLGPTQGELVVVGTDQRFTFPKVISSLSGGLGRFFIVTWDDGTVSQLELSPDNTVSETPLDLPSRYRTATW